MYHHWGCTSLHRPLSIPLDSWWIQLNFLWTVHNIILGQMPWINHNSGNWYLFKLVREKRQIHVCIQRTYFTFPMKTTFYLTVHIIILGQMPWINHNKGNWYSFKVVKQKKWYIFFLYVVQLWYNFL